MYDHFDQILENKSFNLMQQRCKLLNVLIMFFNIHSFLNSPLDVSFQNIELCLFTVLNK